MPSRVAQHRISPAAREGEAAEIRKYVRSGASKMTKKPRPRKSKAFDDINQLTPIKDGDLRRKIIKALKEAGFDWLRDVELARQLQVPNWRIYRVVGVAPNGEEAFKVLNHPAVVELQKRFALLPASAG
jgi:hypothetical protein